MFAMLFSSATMLADDILNRVHPNEASYKIEGNFHYRVIDNKVSYELTNVVPTGLSFKKQDVYYGSQPEGKEVMFTFEKVVTEPGFPGFDNISYWYYDPDIADWQPDVEIKKGEQNAQLNKDVTMMLIIDCSSSLKNDFNVVKEATCNFLDLMYKTAPNGNLHIGIIGFSSIPDTQTFPIKPLDGASYNEMRNFIRNLRSSNGTALFYAWDKAMEQTYSYINSGRMRQYTTSHFVTFTDGIDQTSQDINHCHHRLLMLTITTIILSQQPKTKSQIMKAMLCLLRVWISQMPSNKRSLKISCGNLLFLITIYIMSVLKV